MKHLFVLLLSLGYSHFAFAQFITLPDFLSQISDRNIDVKIEQSKSDLLSAKATAFEIPPPMLGFSRMNEESGSSAQGFEIVQMIPFPTKLSGNRSVRKYEYEAQEESRLASKRQTFLQAKLLYLLLWQSQEKLALLEQKKAILQGHIKVARATARSDSFATVHLLRAESDLDTLDTEIEWLNQMIRERQFEMAGFVGAEPSTYNVTVTEPEISAVPKLISIEDSHFFKAKKLSLESLQAKETAAKSSWLPDFSLRYREMGATKTSMKYNEVMIGVTLPFIFFWEPDSTSKQAVKETQLARYELEKDQRKLKFEKNVLVSRIESLKKQIDILNDKLIPRALKRMRLVRNIVPRDTEALQDHRETMEALPELKIKAIDFRIEYERSVTELNKFVADEDFEK